MGEGVLNNLATGRNSNKKKKNKRTKTDKTRGLGGNEQHVTDGGKGGVNISNNEEADSIVEEIGTADLLSMGNHSNVMES